MAKKETRFGTFEELLDGKDETVAAIATKLRELVFELNPDVVEVVRLGDNASSLGFGPKKMSES